MARYFEIGSNRLAYNMERCEEVVLIDAYLKVRDRLQATSQTRNDFDYYFFSQGQGIAAAVIDGLNLELRRAGFPALEFPETTVYDYGRTSDRTWKAQQRAKIKAELETINTADRERIVASALAEKQALPAPHRTWEEYKEDRERDAEELRQAREAAQRDAMRQRLVTPMTPPKPLQAEIAAKLLAATADEELHDEIIARVPGETTLALIELVDDQALRDKLIRRALTQL
jgi:hypothetical protein